jgi:hypothetical protein
MMTREDAARIMMHWRDHAIVLTARRKAQMPPGAPYVYFMITLCDPITGSKSYIEITPDLLDTCVEALTDVSIIAPAETLWRPPA